MSGFLAAACLWLGASFPTAAETPREAIPAPIRQALNLHKIAPEDLSLYLRAVAAVRPRLAVNTEVPRSPASTIKLLTTVAALDALGPTYRWRTRAYGTGALEDGRLAGNLILKGGGDPNLATEDLWRLLWELRARGLKDIAGNLVIDNGAFAIPEVPRDAFDGAGQDPYNALPVAFAVDRQVTRLQLLPAPSGQGVDAFLMPPLANVSLVNRVQVVKAPCQARHHRVGLRIDERARDATFTLTGTFASECGQDSLARLVLDPVTHAGGAVLALWQGLGGTLAGQILEGPVPRDARLLYTRESDELAVTVRDINKRSDNPMTRALFLTLGMERFGAPGTLEKGRAAVAEWLAEKGIDCPGLVLDNGSGLSRETRIGAGCLGRLLDYAWANPRMAELVASLPIVGVDGTLHRRFRKEPLRGHGHLKTGTLHGATGLAGFVEDREGGRWVMVSLINSPALQGWRGKAVEDAILRWVFAGAPEDADSALRAAR